MRVYNRHTKTCETCGKEFSVPHYRRETAKFCSKSCSAANIAKKYLNKGPKPWAAATLAKHRHKSTSRFKKGHTPWNKGVKGIHLSPESEFKPGCESNRKMEVGSVRVRKDKSGNDRAWVKVGEPSEWKERSRLVWENNNGAIPDGMIIHHEDRDSLNDEISNLRCLTRAEHIEEHRDEMREKKSPEQTGFDL